MNQDSSNIFQQNQNGGGEDMMNQGSMVKTSTAGDVSSAPQGATTGSKKGVTSQYNPEYKSDADVFRANVGKTNVARGGVSNLGQQIAQNRQTLQDRSDAYMQGVRDDNTYDVSEGTLESAITGDDDAYEGISQTLSKQQAEYRPEFEGASGLEVRDIDLLNNQAGIQRLASRGKGPRYTAGMAAFDAGLMQRDPEFQRLVQETRADNRAFERDLAERPDALEAEAQEYADTALDTAQQTAEDYLTNYQKNLEAQNIAEQEAYAQRLEGLDREKIQREALDKALADIMPDLEQAAGGASLDRFLTTSGIDPSDLISYLDSKDLDYRDFVDQGEADRFNRIAGLLGGGETYGAGRLPGDDQMFNIDQRSIEDRLFNEIIGKRNQASIEQENLMRDILSGASGRARTANERVQEMLGTYDADLQGLAEEILYQNQQYNNLRSMLPNLVADYGRPVINTIGTDDVLTQDEVARLNKISGDLGRDRAYNFRGRGAPESLIDRGGFETYLLDRLAKANEDYLANLPTENVIEPYERELTGQGRAVKDLQEGAEYQRRKSQERVTSGTGANPSPFEKLTQAVRRVF